MVGKRVFRTIELTPSEPMRRSNLWVFLASVWAVTFGLFEYSSLETRELMKIFAPCFWATVTSPSWRWARWTTHHLGCQHGSGQVNGLGGGTYGYPRSRRTFGIMRVYPTFVPSLLRMFSSSNSTRLEPIMSATPHFMRSRETLGVIYDYYKSFNPKKRGREKEKKVFTSISYAKEGNNDDGDAYLDTCSNLSKFRSSFEDSDFSSCSA